MGKHFDKIVKRCNKCKCCFIYIYYSVDFSQLLLCLHTYIDIFVKLKFLSISKLTRFSPLPKAQYVIKVRYAIKEPNDTKTIKEIEKKFIVAFEGSADCSLRLTA